ncbi:LPS assembly protein LptD [Gallaecimonas kandeliae]|uniref:LPS assembly protein LptD n=1 Tax=Gallaecimonas kandeliae TaxID=3029055 RepID=UPI0026493233|nr:LPS assembly protein LptD [Gallaecimonas kandeliae]WKE66142.1 LPS assembly protein LptD [Gallaecimonas kandeliae]
MTKVRHWLLISAVAASVSQALAAEGTGSSCPPPPPKAQEQASGKPLSQEAIEASAKKATLDGQQHATLEGDVKLRQGDRLVTADQAEVDRSKGQLRAKGQVSFQDGQLRLSSHTLEAHSDDDSAKLDTVQYQILGTNAHGKAKRMSLSKEKGFTLEGGSFTTCPADNPAWQLDADKIEADPNEGWGSAKGAKFRLFGVPVFYFPYLSFPINNERKSGLLYPTLGTSDKRGLEYAQPIYWNIAPNLDLTLTPRYMSERGTQLNTEFRYLYGEDRGELNLEYLPNDKKFNGDNSKRYLFNWQHNGRFSDHWRYNANYTTVSDDAYFVDLNSNRGSSTDTQIVRSGAIAYLSDDWNFTAEVKNFEVLGAYPDPYQAMPRLTLSREDKDFWEGLDFNFYSELTAFDNQDPTKPTAERLHIEPTLAFPLESPSGSLTTELKLYQTFYQQHDNSGQLADSVSRTLPQLRIYGQLNFERDMKLDGRNYRQTLEPQFQYLFIPKEDQSKIGLYDTSLLREDYHALFRNRRYSGLDRITDANQVTLGVTSRLFDQHNEERLRASLGEVLYLQDSEVGLDNTTGQVSRSTSALAGELDLRIDRSWGISGSMLFDTDSGQTRRGNLTVDYRVSDDKLLQFTHRYVRDITDNENIDQAGISGSWKLDEQWQVFASHYEDLRLHRTEETYAGFEYEACCFAVRMTVRRRLNPILSDGPEFTGQSTFDNSISLEFIFKGLGGGGSSGDKLLSKGLFSYREPYNLSY